MPSIQPDTVFKFDVTKFTAYLLAAFIASFYFSTSLSTILTAVVILLWLGLGHYRTLYKDLADVPTAAWALGLYLIFVLGSFYGPASFADTVAMLGKYREFLLVAVLVAFFNNNHCRLLGWKSIELASVFTLLISYMMYFDVLAANRQGDFCLKSRITHSVLMAFFMFYCAHQFYEKPDRRLRYGLLAALSVYNLFYVVQGRTGQLVAVALGLLFVIQRFKIRQAFLALSVMAVFLTLFMTFSDKSARIYEGLANTQAYFQAASGSSDSSMGLRYTFWQRSLELIQERPFFGHGTGSFNQAYQSINPDAAASTHNPHNEFLMIGVQWGWVGLMVYGGFLASQYIAALRLPYPQLWYAQGLWVVLLATSLFNSPFLDHSGHWFAATIAIIYASSQAETSWPKCKASRVGSIS